VTRFFVVSLLAAVSCTSSDPREEASKYAIDPIPCSQDSDCCVVNDGCQSTAYVVASKDSTTVASLISSADTTMCNLCITPMLQVSCGSTHTCLAARFDAFDPTCSAALQPGFRYGNHCGKLDLPEACLPSTTADAGSPSTVGETAKPLSTFRCGE